MDHADPPIPVRQARITWAEADRLFLRRDRLLDRTGEKLALTEAGNCDHAVAIVRDRPFVFGYGGVEPALRAEHLALARCATGSRGEVVSTSAISASAHSRSAAGVSVI